MRCDAMRCECAAHVAGGGGDDAPETAVGAFGPATAKTVEDEGLRLDLEAPNKAFPSMTGALADYLKRHNK